MQRVYGEFDIPKTTTTDNVVQAIKNKETELNLNPVPEHFVLRKLGIKVDAACDVAINGRDFSINEKEPLEFGYDSIKVDSIVFRSADISAIVRYMYFREDRTYQ
jgi:hypothetical protein